MNFEKTKTKTKIISKRLFNVNNIQNFKNALASMSWNSTMDKDDTAMAFDCFWRDFSDLYPRYNLHFPLTKFKFNKNVHKINNYMMAGLLISRKKKLELCKKASKDRTEESIQSYRAYLNVFNTLMRASKTIYFSNGLKSNQRDPKKTWELLKEAANLHSSREGVEKIKVNNVTINDPGQVASNF